MLYITDHISLDEAELKESFIRASGPGGQNVNKVSSAVQLRFDLMACEALAPDIKARAKKMAGGRFTKDGIIVIEASNNRTQKANRQEARSRLAQLLRAAVPPPIQRRKTKPSRGAIERRLKEKKKRGQAKAGRKVSTRDLD